MNDNSISLKSQIQQWMQEHRSEGVSLLQEMVKFPSIQGNEQEIQHFVANKLQLLGMEVELWEPDGDELSKHPYFYSPRNRFDGSPNVVGIWRGTGGGRSILLNGHVDVVPAGDIVQWNDDPYSGKVVDGKLYGRGSTDMKGGNTSMLLAIQALKDLGIRLKGDVIFESVMEEESGGAGTLAAILKGYRADAAIIPEPTNMKIFAKQQGSMWFRIHVKGRAAHGGTRYEGVSAIEKSMTVIAHIRELEERRNSTVTDPLYANNPIPYPINIGVIKGGNWPSSVPDEVIMEGRFGVAPEEEMEQGKAKMIEWMELLKEKDPWFETHPVLVEWFGARWVPGSVNPEHDLIRTLSEQYKEVLNEEPVIEASPWGTDGGLLTRLANTPCIVFGPGVTSVAHFPNEYIEMERVIKAAEIFALTLVQWCGWEEEGNGGREEQVH